MELKGKNVIVVGTGVSGIGAVKLLSRVGAVITLYDSNEKVSIKDIENKLPEGVKADIVTDPMSDALVDKADLLVISPGVPIDSPVVKLFEEHEVPVWGEIELAYNYEKGTVMAITGTNGKTTTTSLVGEIMKNFNSKTYVVGNIGNSYTGEVLNTTADSITVAEISSFQLETIHEFLPKGSAILNITPDHLNRHYTMENYTAVKESITKNQSKMDFCVLNYDDEVLRRFGKDCNARPIYFSRKAVPPTGAYLKDDMIHYIDANDDIEIINIHDMMLFGNHNYENVMAAVALTYNMGVPVDVIKNTIKSFKGVEHRIEYVREHNNVVYYNDSKGTNPDSSIKAIESMSRPTIIIGGGYDKHSEYDQFIGAFGTKIKELVLIGETADKIEAEARKQGFTAIRRATTLQEAVKFCAEDAVSGDAVLLSPACASWDMFKSYEERGKLFKEYVMQL